MTILCKPVSSKYLSNKYASIFKIINVSIYFQKESNNTVFVLKNDNKNILKTWL